MVWNLPPDAARLLALAEEAPPADAQAAEAWPAILTAIRSGWLRPGDGPESVAWTVDRVERTGLASVEEYALEDDHADAARLTVSAVTDVWSVPREPFLAALRRLDDDFRAGRRPAGGPADDGPGHAGDAPAATDLPDPGMLRAALRQLLGVTDQAPDTPEAARLRTQARAEFDRLAGAGDAELRSGLDALTDPDRERLASALRSLADWAEQPQGRGAAVDAIVADLEASIGSLLPGRRAEEAATDARIRGSAQDAIARRLRGG